MQKRFKCYKRTQQILHLSLRINKWRTKNNFYVQYRGISTNKLKWNERIRNSSSSKVLMDNCHQWLPALAQREITKHYVPSYWKYLGFPGSSVGKEFTCNAGGPGLIPGWGRTPGKEMAAHSSILVWKIPWTEEPGRLQSMGLKRVRHDLVTKPPLEVHNITYGVVLENKRKYKQNLIKSLPLTSNEKKYRRLKNMLKDTKLLQSTKSTLWETGQNTRHIYVFH